VARSPRVRNPENAVANPAWNQANPSVEEGDCSVFAAASCGVGSRSDDAENEIASVAVARTALELGDLGIMRQIEMTTKRDVFRGFAAYGTEFRVIARYTEYD